MSSSTTRPTTMVWSPPSCPASISQSIHASTPSRIGEPFADSCHFTPANLSPPLTANPRDSSSWSSDNTFAQKRPALRMRGQEVEDFAGAKKTYGGDPDSERKDCNESSTK